MIKPLFVSLFAISIAVSGCMMSKSASDKDKQKEAGDDRLVYPIPPEEPRFYYEKTIKSSADVLPDSDEDKLRRSLTGERLQGEGFAKPYGIAVHRGRIFVGDTVRRMVMALDIPEQKFIKIGQYEEEGEGRLSKPMGIEVDDSGNLYVLDATYKQIIVYNRDGQFLRNIGKATDFYRPAGIGVSGDGSRIYAVDIGGSSSDNHRIIAYDGNTGERLPDIGKRGIELGEFNLPRDVVVAPDGSLFVVDGGNFRVQHIAADGKPINSFGSIGRQQGQFSRPKEIGVDSESNVYVVDAAFGNFQIFNSEGQLLLYVGERSNIDGPGKFSLPSGIAVDDDGRVYMVDQFFRKIDVFRPADLPENEGFVKNAVGKESGDQAGQAN